jgi:acyl transferase domain-containing protein
MSEIAPQYEESLASHIHHNDSMRPLFSSVTSTTITEPSELSASYWRRNLESPVRFSSAVRSLLSKSKNRAFLEIGPHSALSGPLQQIFRALETKSDFTYIPTLTRYESNSRAQLLSSAGLAHSCGVSIDLEAINGTGNTLGNLPPYPWQHSTKYWHDSRLTRDWRFRKYLHHEILGARSVESSELEPAWRNVLRLEDVPWISEHALQGNVIFPAAGYISMAGEAALQLNPDANDYSIKNMVIKNPLLMKESADYELITTLKPVKITDLLESEWYAFTIASFDGTSWTKHCHGQVRAGTDNDHAPPGRAITQHARVLDVDTCYRYVDRLGFAYGPLFRRFQSLSVDPTTRKAAGTLLDLDITPPSRYTLHPAIMDHLLQTFPMAIAQGLSRRFQIIVPAAIGHIYVRPPAIKEMSLEAFMAETGFGTWTGQGIMMAGEELVLSMTDLAGFPASAADAVASGIPVGSQIRWKPDVDFVHPSSLLKPSVLDERYEKVMAASRDLAALYVLNMAAKVANITSEPEKVQWKTWITETASRLEKQYPEWSRMSPDAREDLITTISSQVPKEDDDEPAPLVCMRYIYEHCVEIITAKTLPDEALSQIDNYATYLQATQDWSHFLSLLGHSNPVMRILEIGDGIGAATSAVLKHLKSPEGVRLYSSYTVTNAAEENLESAKKRFVDEDVEFKEFDVTKGVEQQGFELHSYDLVIASKVRTNLAGKVSSLTAR